MKNAKIVKMMDANERLAYYLKKNAEAYDAKNSLTGGAAFAALEKLDLKNGEGSVRKLVDAVGMEDGNLFGVPGYFVNKYLEGETVKDRQFAELWNVFLSVRNPDYGVVDEELRDGDFFGVFPRDASDIPATIGVLGNAGDYMGFVDLGRRFPFPDFLEEDAGDACGVVTKITLPWFPETHQGRQADFAYGYARCVCAYANETCIGVGFKLLDGTVVID